MRLERLITFHGREGPVLLIVADGVGIAPAGPANALSLARTPIIDNLLSGQHSICLHAHGTWVGLPTDNDMGNSEVGHNALGSGRIHDQGATLVNHSIKTGELFQGEHWNTLVARGREGGTIHFIGLLSDGNVHAHIDHLLEMLDQCRRSAIRSVRIHALLDGRDVDPRSAPGYLDALEARLSQINRGGEFDYRVASGGGRMVITMDRYEADWEMVERGFNLHVHGRVGETGREVSSAVEEVRRQYREGNVTDQYLAPFVVTDDRGPIGIMKDGDGVVLFNFRGDRAIEISRALESETFSEFDRGALPDIHFCGMLQYDGDLEIPQNHLVRPPVMERTMSEYLCGERLHSFAVSETQKFGHVTYFWNGNRSGYIDEALEKYVEIPSDNRQCDQVPHMKAREITDAAIELLDCGQYRFGRINFANGDMVGHTGNMEATVQALECVDECIGRLLEWIRNRNGVLVFTADHGNADEMFVEREGRRIPRTSHTLNPVPFVIADAHEDIPYVVDPDVQGGLANVAATVFNLLGYRAPDDYEPSLITFPQEPRRHAVFRGRVVNLGIETAVLPDGEMQSVEVLRHPGGAVIAAIDDGKICLIRQYRHAAGGWIWELPAGIFEAGEDAESTARRELLEETGCIATDWKYLGNLFTSPGFTDETLSVYLATGISGGPASPEPHERIEIHWTEWNQVDRMIRNGTIRDAKSIVALHLLNDHRDLIS